MNARETCSRATIFLRPGLDSASDKHVWHFDAKLSIFEVTHGLL